MNTRARVLHLSERNVAIVRGGTDETLLSDLLSVIEGRVGIFADRANASTLAVLFSGRVDRKIDLKLSHGIDKDLKEVIACSQPCTFIVHHALFRREVLLKVRQLAQAMLAIAGYGTPLAIIERLAADRIRYMLKSVETQSRATLIVCDDTMLLPTDLVDAFYAFDAGPAQPMEAVTIPGALDPNDRAPVSECARHAEFLAKNELATLLRMHAFLAHHDARPAFDYWRSALASAKRELGYEMFVQLGLERLAEIERALA